MAQTSRHAILACLTFSTIGAAACGSSDTPKSANADSRPVLSPESLSPVETARALHQLRWNRDFETLGTMLAPENRRSTIRFLNSIDQVLDAHDQLQEAARKRFGDRIHHAWNISAMENNLGIFSRDVRMINQSLKGDHAVVTLQAGDNLPLIRSEFDRIDRKWILKSPFADTSICDPLDQFAMQIDDVAERIRIGLTPMEYFDAVTNELLPGMAQVAAGSSIDETRVSDATDRTP